MFPESKFQSSFKALNPLRLKGLRKLKEVSFQCNLNLHEDLDCKFKNLIYLQFCTFRGVKDAEREPPKSSKSASQWGLRCRGRVYRRGRNTQIHSVKKYYYFEMNQQSIRSKKCSCLYQDLIRRPTYLPNYLTSSDATNYATDDLINPCI